MPTGVKVFKRPKSFQQRKQSRQEFVAMQRKLERMEIDSMRARAGDKKLIEDKEVKLQSGEKRNKQLGREIALLKEENRTVKKALLEVSKALSIKGRASLSKDVKKFVGLKE